MRRLRSLQLLSLVVAIALAACGGSETPPGGDGTGGTGGGGGGGGGSCESPTGKPRACSVDPDSGPEGASVKIEGVNFPTSLSKVRVKFNGLAGIVTSVDDVGGTWIAATVPSKATTGAINLELDSGNGFVTIVGPNFTVTDDRPVPVLNSLNPASSTEGVALTAGISLSGTGFRSTSVVELDGERIEAQFQNSTSIKIPTVPAAKLAKAGTFSIRVINEPPGGGTSATLNFQVVSALEVVSAEAVGSSRIRLTFNRAVNRGAAAPSRNANRVYSVSPGLTVKDAQMDGTSNNRSVFVTTTANQKPDTDYTISVIADVTSAEGGVLRGKTSATFRGFNSTPTADGIFGAVGCDASSLSGPLGLAMLGTDLYVTEESGNQVQRISIAGDDPQFQGFYGNDGSTAGYFSDTSAVAAGCPGGSVEAPNSLAGPRGAPGIDPIAGDVYVADTNHDRIVRFKGGALQEFKRGDDYLADKDKWSSPVVLGAIGNQVLVAASDEKIHRLFFDGSREPEATGGRGFGAGNFRFNLSGPPDDCQIGDARLECSYDGGGVPSMGWDAASKFAYVSEPGNHRVQRLKVDTANGNKLASSGAIGKGVTKFGSLMPSEQAGTGNGEFTRPSGVAVDAAGFIYVADEAGGGRVQRFDSAGAWLRTMPLGFVPGGLVVDRDNRLWISDPVGGRLLRFKL